MKIVSHEEIGRAIRQRRRELKLSQEDVASRLNVSYQQVQRYEAGKNNISVETLQTIALILCVPMSYFLGNCTQAPDKGDETQVFGERELVGNYRQIRHKKTRALVLNFTQLVAQGDTWKSS